MSFASMFARVSDVVEDRYGIAVGDSDLPPPRTGQFDGRSIVLDTWNSEEADLFVLCHLFGHTVQWCRGQRDVPVKPGNPDPAALARAYRYEEEASCYGLALLEAAGIQDRASWMTRWFLGDWAYLKEFYRTGVLPAAMHPARKAPATLLPSAIPPFKPRRFKPRYAF